MKSTEPFHDLLLLKERCCAELKAFLDKAVNGNMAQRPWGLEIVEKVDTYLRRMKDIDSELAAAGAGTIDKIDSASLNKTLDNIESSLRAAISNLRLLQLRFAAAKALVGEKLKTVSGSKAINYLNADMQNLSEMVRS